MSLVLDILIIITSIFLITLIIIQQRGGSLGSFFGFSGSLPFMQRRGVEKYIYQITWLLAIIFLFLSYLRIMNF